MKIIKIIIFIFCICNIMSVYAQNGTVKSFSKIYTGHNGFNAILPTGANFGNSVSGVGDLNKDGIEDIAIGSLMDNLGGSLFILFMNKDGSVKSYSEIKAGQSGLPSNQPYGTKDFGCAVDTIGDLNNDGVVDLVVGMPSVLRGGYNDGYVYILFMNADGTVKSYKIIGENEGGFNVTLDNTLFGYSVCGIGDFNKDGVLDIAVGGIQNENYIGAVWLLYLNTDGSVKSFQLIDSSISLLNPYLATSSSFGSDVEILGDLDKDGNNDLLIGAKSKKHNNRKGSSFVLFMNSDISIREVKEIFPGMIGFVDTLNDINSFGKSVSRLGDINGDKIIDIAISDPSYIDSSSIQSGCLWIIMLDTLANVKSFQRISNQTGNFNAQLDNLDVFGMSLSGLIDFNGDRISDILVSARSDDDAGTDKGAVYILNLNGVPIPSIVKIPVASYNYDTTNMPTLKFTDKSINAPTSWLWDFDDTGDDTSALQNPTYTFKSGGTHNVCLTATNSAGSSTAYCKSILIHGTGIEDLRYRHLVAIYPNPAAENITFKTNIPVISYTILDFSGREVLKVSTCISANAINIRYLPSGFYIINLFTNKGILTGQFIKE